VKGQRDRVPRSNNRAKQFPNRKGEGGGSHKCQNLRNNPGSSSEGMRLR